MLTGSFTKIFGRFCVLLLPLNAFAPQDQSKWIQTSVLVRSVSIGRASPATPGAVPVHAELQNISGKSIYAFDIECTATYSDGSTRATMSGVDLLANYVFELKDPALTPRPNMLLRPGESYATGTSAPLGEGWSTAGRRIVRRHAARVRRSDGVWGSLRYPKGRTRAVVSLRSILWRCVGHEIRG